MKIKKNLSILLASIMMGVFVSLAFAISTRAYSERVMNNITDSVFRLHILANSNSPNDQALKLLVRNEILSRYEDFLSASPSKAETAEFFRNHIEEIEEVGEEVLREKGSDYVVKAEVARDRFPVKRYGDVTLPAGEYDCLRIEIGKGKGHNWWCVMFPPLCYVEGTYEEMEEGNYKEDFDEEAYEVILGESDKAKPQVKVKLKIVELWQGAENN